MWSFAATASQGGRDARTTVRILYFSALGVGVGELRAGRLRDGLIFSARDVAWKAFLNRLASGHEAIGSPN